MTDELKKSAAQKALELVQDGMLLGLGSGTTSKYFTEGVGRLVAVIKGRGAALFREKLVAEASKRFIVIVDDSKLVKQLGVGELPVEVLPFLWRRTAERLTALGASLTVRGGEETPYITDNGNLILNLVVEGGIKDTAAFATALKGTTGVVEHGLFVGLTDTLIIGGPEGPKVVGRGGSA